MRFLQITDNSFVGRIVNGRANVLKDLDPNRIYVEQIRSFYGLSFRVAKFLCDMAVRQGYLTKHVGIECPNEGRLIKTYNSVTEIPEIIECFNCQVLDKEEYIFRTAECAHIEFYKLVPR